jgi:hypothetical protein
MVRQAVKEALNKPRLQTRGPATERFCLPTRGLHVNHRLPSLRIAHFLSNPPYRRRIYPVARKARLA